jgi:putative peptidoglycan binding protein
MLICARIRERCNMKITTISKVASFVISFVMIQSAVAGHAVAIGVGPHFGGGGFGGGTFEMLFGGGGFHSAPAFGGGNHLSFGARPTFGQPVIVRSPSRITTSPSRLTIPSHQRDSVSSIDRQSTANSRPEIDSRTQQPYQTVRAVQQNLIKLGYYHGSIDGLYGRATRDAVVRYQTDHHLAVTGTLTSQMLQLLGVSLTGRTGIGSVAGPGSLKES